MDIMKPQIINVDGRRYRKMPYRSVAVNDNDSVAQRVSNERIAWEDERCDDQEDVSVKKTDKGFTLHYSDIPSFYYKFICGKRNECKARIERETKTQIAIPRPGVEGDIVITGMEKCGVLSAKSRIELIVESARLRQVPTHFISIPLACKNTKERFEEFKVAVLEECSECKGIDDRILQVPEKLHLTIGMMTLMSDVEIAKAVTALQDLESDMNKFTSNHPMKILLEGVDCMNDDPSEVAVLFAKVKLSDGSNRLQELVDFIADSFVSKGIMRREYDRVKLHATVMNTSFRDRLEETNTDRGASADSRKEGNKKPKKTFFDARRVLQIFEKFDFGTKDLDSIHLSKRGSFGDDGFYFCESSINM